MGRGDQPGEFELVVLLTLAGCDTDVPGRAVYDRITRTTGRDSSVAAVHITLARLAEKGWATCTTRPPEPGAGGKPRRSYGLSPDGARVLERQRETLERLWGRAQDHPLLGGGGG